MTKHNLKIKSVFRPLDRLEEFVKETGYLPRFNNWGLDYWEIGKQLCQKDGGEMANMKELAQIASYIYGTKIEKMKDASGLEFNSERAKELGLPSSSGFYVWSSKKYGSNSAYRRSFCSAHSYYYNNNCDNSGYWVVCLGD